MGIISCKRRCWRSRFLIVVTQLVDSKTKGVPFCKAVEKSELSTSSLAVTRSILIPQVSNAIKESKDLKSRTYKNEKDKDFLRDKLHNAEVLTTAYSRCQEAQVVLRNGTKHCKSILMKDIFYHEDRQYYTVSK